MDSRLTEEQSAMNSFTKCEAEASSKSNMPGNYPENVSIYTAEISTADKEIKQRCAIFSAELTVLNKVFSQGCSHLLLIIS